jgi:hypothetical protein
VSAGGLRPLGFVLLMFGFGLRLDTDWQALAWVLLVAGALAGAAGLWGFTRDADRSSAFVPPPGKG